MRDDRLRVSDALDQIHLIEQFATAGRDAFFGDLVLQSAILHRLALLGEACRSISPDVRERHQEIPWAQVIAFRNILIHEYFGVDLELVWEVVAEHLDNLKAGLIAILAQLPTGG